MVLVIDFGSQYTELLVRQVRQNSIFAEIKGCCDPSLIQEASKYKAFILSGSPCCAKDEMHEELFRKLLELKKPMLCVCYGMQVMHKMMGGEVAYDGCSEFGSTEVKIVKDHYIVDGIPAKFTTWMSHNDSVVKLAPGFVSIAVTPACHAVSVHDQKQIYTIQFHPEVEHANYGDRLIRNFLFLICKLRPNWNIGGTIEERIRQIKEQVGSEKVYLALSGGIDSSVVAKLLKESGVDANYIFVNTGLMWDKKIEGALDWLRREFGDKLITVDAKEKFFEGLSGIVDPEQKRNKVGTMFMEVFTQELQSRGDSKFLAQGTIKSDLIESGKKRANAIKTHHNTISELKSNLNVLEPISDLFKDEVRVLAKKLNVPDHIINAHPFPGPGYAIRVLGEVTSEKVEILKEVDQIIMEELDKRGLYSGISQCFAVMVSGKSVGVIGDQRCYGHIVAIRSINSQNMMTAKPSLIPINILVEIGDAIINQVKEVSRVVYDLTSKPPATIEWE